MRPTRALTGVLPSAPSQLSVPTALRVFRVLSSASRTTARPSYTRQAVRELRARYCSGTIDHLPEAGIQTKGEIEARDRLDELARDVEHARGQLRVSGEEEDIREKPLERAPWRDRFDGMSAAMVEKVDTPERGGPILPRARELAPERGAVTACTPVGEPHDGELVAQQRRVGREPRERRLAGPRGAGEKMRPSVSDEAGRVHDEPVSIEERERVQDSQEAVDRVLVGVAKRHARATLRQIHRPHEVPALDDEPSALTVTGDEDVAVSPMTDAFPPVNLAS